MISVTKARDHLFSLISPLATEFVPLTKAAGRVLSQPVQARRDQPPFAASAMDGYAVKSTEVERHAMFKLIGESAAGHRFEGSVEPGQAVRIFTGAPVPEGADFVVIQEDTSRKDDVITITDDPGANANIRAAGGDFAAGSTLDAPRLLSPEDIALLASMNIPNVPVARKPVVALISTGDELVMPGDTPGPDQIIASNTFGLGALLTARGADVRILPIARDTESSLRTAFSLAEGVDLVITIGGASVGDHDLVGDVAQSLGLDRSFYKVAMRPGKPLMAGRMGDSAMVGLPGNPVSAMVCGHVFILPMLRHMLGLGAGAPDLKQAELARDIDQNGPREHYMRALVHGGKLNAFDNQDSANLRLLSSANALLVRAPNAGPQTVGTTVEYLPLWG
jgi:molybdopterin molybdotransferase